MLALGRSWHQCRLRISRSDDVFSTSTTLAKILCSHALPRSLTFASDASCRLSTEPQELQSFKHDYRGSFVSASHARNTLQTRYNSYYCGKYDYQAWRDVGWIHTCAIRRDANYSCTAYFVAPHSSQACGTRVYSAILGSSLPYFSNNASSLSVRAADREFE